MGATRLLAVDLGASGGKCFAATFEDGAFSMREIHRFAHEGVSFFLPEADGRLTERTHWDDTWLYQNILAGLRAYRRDVSDRLDAIGIDAWGADGQLVSVNGEVLGKVYCYRDHRLDDMVAAVKACVPADRMYEITGIHFQPFNVSNQLRWLVTNRKDLVRPDCSYLPIPSLFYYYLGGVRDVDSSWASVTQLMDAETHEWSREILRALDIPRRIMPRIVEPGTPIGKLSKPLADSLGLNPATLVAVGSHDTACAFAAAPVANADAALIVSSGTWSLVGKLIPVPITTEAAMAANISNEGGIGNTRFLKNCMGTWIVQELRRAWAVADGRETGWDQITAAAAAAPAFQSLIDPDDPGFYNPPNMERAIAEFCRRTGQAAPADRGAFARLVYESLALKYRLVSGHLTSVCGRPSSVVHIVGGGSKNAILNQFAADSLGLPVLAGPEEATAVGNLMVQAMGLGVIRSMADALPIVRSAFPIKEYEPRNHGSWEEPYQRFRRVCERAAGRT